MNTFRQFVAPISRLCRTAGRSASDGQSMVMFALGLTVLAGSAALSVDGGGILVARRGGQNAADAAALAAANVLFDGGSRTAAVAEAQKFATANGFGGSVTVNVPPTTGPRAGDATAVEVIAHRTVAPRFAQVLGAGPWDISARAVGQIKREDRGFGVITLDPSRCDSLQITSSAVLDVTNGGVYVNSSCEGGDNAMSLGSSALARGQVISIVGGYELGSSAVTSPTPRTHQLPVPDPWAALPVPPMGVGTDRTGGGCEFKDRTITLQPGVYRCAPLVIDGGTVTFAAGNYTFQGGLKITGSARVTFGRGIFVMRGGGFQMTSNTSLSNSDGMLIYNTCNGSCVRDKDWFRAESGTTITAKPYGEPYAHLMVWQDRAVTQSVDFNSSSRVILRDGARAGIYAANATINYDCNTTVPLQFVARNVFMGSSARIVVDVVGLPPASVAAVGLVE